MTRSPLLLHEHLPLPSGALLLVQHDIGGAPVVDDDDTLIGVLTESHLLAREAAPRQRAGRLAREEERLRAAATVGEACSRPSAITSPGVALRTPVSAVRSRGSQRVPRMYSRP